MLKKKLTASADASLELLPTSKPTRLGAGHGRFAYQQCIGPSAPIPDNSRKHGSSRSERDRRFQRLAFPKPPIVLPAQRECSLRWLGHRHLGVAIFNLAATLAQQIHQSVTGRLVLVIHVRLISEAKNENLGPVESNPMRDISGMDALILPASSMKRVPAILRRVNQETVSEYSRA
jgi:hypothetical protein